MGKNMGKNSGALHAENPFVRSPPTPWRRRLSIGRSMNFQLDGT